MTPEERAQMATKVRVEMDRINGAHNVDNLERLRAEASRRGFKLTGTLRRKSGFALRIPAGSSVSGITLADVEAMLGKLG